MKKREPKSYLELAMGEPNPLHQLESNGKKLGKVIMLSSCPDFDLYARRSWSALFGTMKGFVPIDNTWPEDTSKNY